MTAADEHLTDAVRDVIQTSHGERFSASVLTDHVTIAATVNFDDDGIPMTAVHIIPKGGGDVAPHVLIGLLEYAVARLKADVTREEPM